MRSSCGVEASALASGRDASREVASTPAGHPPFGEFPLRSG